MLIIDPGTLRLPPSAVGEHRSPPTSLQNITYGLYFPASAFSRTFIRSLLPLKPLIFVGVLPVAG